MKIVLAIFLFISTLHLASQNAQRIIISSDYTDTLKNDSNFIETLKFYLTNFSLSKSGKVIWIERDSYHLIDFSDNNSLSFDLNVLDSLVFDEIHFSLGTDSLTNVSGVMGNDLDPTNGMYWAWNSGYINFKIEGKKNSTLFEFHLGGYSPPFQTVQQLSLKSNGEKAININLNILKFINQLDVTKQNKLLSPGKEAQQLSKLLASFFNIK
jgi:hypothetical protein